MPSTACSCIGELRQRRLEVVVVDPACRVHGEPVSAASADIQG